jgi:hypothetical protein
MRISAASDQKEETRMDEEPRNLRLVPETATSPIPDETEWVEEIDESDLPPNEWQQRLDERIKLEHSIWEERMAAIEEPTTEEPSPEVE